jgi:hypothetical protein
MKGIQPRLTAFLLLVTMAIGCKREPIIEKPVQPTKKTKLAQIASEFGKTEVMYNEDGAVKETVLSNIRGYLERAEFRYKDNKLQTLAVNGVEFKYEFENEKVSSIEVFPEPGKMTERYEYVYSNNVLAERIKLVKVDYTPEMVPYSKIKYSFSPSGNLLRTQSFSWIFRGWNGAGEVVSYEYDNKENTLSHFEAEPFLPENTLMKNNPVKIVYTTALGDTTKTIIHSYTYNQYQQPVTRQTVVSAVGFGGTTTDYTISYGK